MMNSKTYVSDPKIWESFYQNMANKSFNPYKYKPKQKGRGWSFKKSYRIPVRPHSKLDIQPRVPLVSPVAAVEERVKEEYNKDIQAGNPHVTPITGIKRAELTPEFISSKKLKVSATKSVPTKSTQKVSGRKTAKSNQRLAEKRKYFKVDDYKTIFKS